MSGWVIGFINNLKVVSTNNDYILAYLNNYGHTNIFSLSPLVFMDL
jgi:hypothetical protein